MGERNGCVGCGRTGFMPEQTNAVTGAASICLDLSAEVIKSLQSLGLAPITDNSSKGTAAIGAEDALCLTSSHVELHLKEHSVVPSKPLTRDESNCFTVRSLTIPSGRFFNPSQK